jgi:hypothetical protein
LLIAILECISIGWVYGKNQVVIIFQSAKQWEMHFLGTVSC